MLTVEEISEGFSCFIPTIDYVKDMKALFKVWSTHNWVFDNVEPFGNDGIITSIHCENCGLERKAIHSNITESAMRAMQNKERNKL